MPPVQSRPIDPAHFVVECSHLARTRGFRVSSFGMRDGIPLVAFVRHGPIGGPRFYLSAGSHGDEPAPPLAIERMLENDGFDRAASWYIAPLINPTGLRRGQRESRDGIDLNWDYRQPISPEIIAHTRWLEAQPGFDLALCLHEDWEASGFYLYDHDPAEQPDLVHAMLEAAGTHVPIALETVIDGWRVDETGVIRPFINTRTHPRWPEAVYLRQRHTRLCYTTETPSSLAMEERIRAIEAVVQTATADIMKQFRARRRPAVATSTSRRARRPAAAPTTEAKSSASASSMSETI